MQDKFVLNSDVCTSCTSQVLDVECVVLAKDFAVEATDGLIAEDEVVGGLATNFGTGLVYSKDVFMGFINRLKNKFRVIICLTLLNIMIIINYRVNILLVDLVLDIKTLIFVN